jgi:hypothetical protein
MVASKTGGGLPSSPWAFYDSGGDYLGRSITGVVTFGADQVLTGATVTRDAGCQYTKIIVGDPAAPLRTINVAGLEGSRSFTKAQLNAVGLTVLTDIYGLQITASP